MCRPLLLSREARLLPDHGYRLQILPPVPPVFPKMHFLQTGYFRYGQTRICHTLRSPLNFHRFPAPAHSRPSFPDYPASRTRAALFRSCLSAYRVWNPYFPHSTVLLRMRLLSSSRPAESLSLPLCPGLRQSFPSLPHTRRHLRRLPLHSPVHGSVPGPPLSAHHKTNFESQFYRNHCRFHWTGSEHNLR